MRGFQYWSVYNLIAQTLHRDAAPGRLRSGDATVCGSGLAKASLDANASTGLFMQAARQLIASAHASATCTVASGDPDWQEQTVGFTAKREGDKLFVAGVAGDDRLAPGMRIAALDDSPISQVVTDFGADIFGGRGSDRESWDLALPMFDHMEVFPGDGSAKRLDIRRFPAPADRPAIAVDQPALGLARLRLGTLADPEGLGEALAQGASLIAGANRLVVDLRGCKGEADPAAWLVLLPYLVDADVPAAQVFPDRDVWTIYSAENVNRLTALLERARDAVVEEARPQAQALIDEVAQKGQTALEAIRATLDNLERRRAAELAEVVPSPFADERVAKQAQAPEDVVLLVDETCGIGAERLAQACLPLARVRLVGRATPGAVDYDNYLTATYEDVKASFTFPISRSDANKQGEGYAETGLPLDVHVPFRAADAGRDADLEAAAQLPAR